MKTTTKPSLWELRREFDRLDRQFELARIALRQSASTEAVERVNALAQASEDAWERWNAAQLQAESLYTMPRS